MGKESHNNTEIFYINKVSGICAVGDKVVFVPAYSEGRVIDATVIDISKEPVKRTTIKLDLDPLSYVPIYTVRVTSNRLRKNVRTIYRWIQKGKLAYTYKNGKLMVAFGDFYKAI